MEKKLTIKEKIILGILLFVVQLLAGSDYSIKETVNSNVESIKKLIKDE